jgi:predicted short-subunit dehydrogenase-like oxidoreductase (DUF2520 family)
MELQRHGLLIQEVYSPNHDHASQLAESLNCRVAGSLQALGLASDLYLLAIPDAKIPEAAANLPMVKGVVAHTSGNTPMADLSGFPRHGVFWPLQTFTRSKTIDFAQVPVCLEANTREVLEELSGLANKISNVVRLIDSNQRQLLHMTAVLVNNFSNHLYHMAEELLEKNDIDFNLLRPLILESAAKVQEMSPADAQTGPARRGDESTIARHLELISSDPGLKALYQLMSNQILKKYHE